LNLLAEVILSLPYQKTGFLFFDMTFGTYRYWMVETHALIVDKNK